MRIDYIRAYTLDDVTGTLGMARDVADAPQDWLV